MILKPAILYKAEILQKSQELFYTDDMMYYNGYLGSSGIEIQDKGDDFRYNYAVIDDKKNSTLVGFISFYIDWDARNAYNFGMMSFDRRNPAMGWAIKRVMDMLIKQYHMHRIEFCCIGGNPVKRHYDKFCKRLNGRIIELRDTFKDRTGEYRNRYIYEILL